MLSGILGSRWLPLGLNAAAEDLDLVFVEEVLKLLLQVAKILDALAMRGIHNNDKKRIVGIAQGWQLGRAIKTLERHLADGSFVHGAQPLMAWCLGNAKVEPRANGILITKQASGTAKIDALMATFNATDLMSLDPALPGGGPSIYETRTMLVV
jgi:phage terminase large subunit-like protein